MLPITSHLKNHTDVASVFQCGKFLFFIYRIAHHYNLLKSQTGNIADMNYYHKYLGEKKDHPIGQITEFSKNHYIELPENNNIIKCYLK